MSTHKSRSPHTRAHPEPIVIFGVGLVGGSFGLALRARSDAPRVIGVDRPRALGIARRRRAIHRGLDQHELLSSLAELRPRAIVLALPVPALLELLPRLAAASRALPVRDRPLVLDVASVKGSVVEAATGANCPRFVGGHPMAGAERGGILNARRDLFVDAPFVLCTDTGSRADQTAARRLVESVGARPVKLDAHTHDRCVALTSHLPHLLAWCLVQAAATLEERLDTRGLPWKLGAGSWTSATRVAASDVKLWAPILEHNREAVIESLQLLEESLARVREGLSAGHDVLLDPEVGLDAGRLAAIVRRQQGR